MRMRMRAGAGAGVLGGGLAAFAIAVAIYVGYALTHRMFYWMEPVDLRVYRFGGLIAAHVRPWYNPGRAAPLYDWPGYLNLKFTYTPFAALVFTILTVPGLRLLENLSIAVNITAAVAAIWFTLGGVEREVRGTGAGPAGTDAAGTDSARQDTARQDTAGTGVADSGAARMGTTLLIAAVLFWTEPVQRTIFLGQVELVLMALIMWDVCQPDRRWWKGAGIGIAAGIKLVPLIFIPYLLLTRRLRQAAVAMATFAVTVAAGFAAMPADSGRWWLGGLFARGSRTGFVGWEGNQSLLAVVTRLAGSIAGGALPWIVLATLTVMAGLACATVISRAGYPLAGVLTCALTGLLVSPISWDHHWVWIVPAVTVLAGYAMRSPGAVRRALLGLAAGIVGIFAAWPVSLLGQDLGGFSLGLIWLPPNTNPGTYYQRGDRAWYPEYHWHGAELLTGNLYVLTGSLVLAGLIAFAVRSLRGSSRPDPQRETRATTTHRVTRATTTHSSTEATGFRELASSRLWAWRSARLTMMSWPPIASAGRRGGRGPG